MNDDLDSGLERANGLAVVLSSIALLLCVVALKTPTIAGDWESYDSTLGAAAAITGSAGITLAVIRLWRGQRNPVYWIYLVVMAIAVIIGYGFIYYALGEFEYEKEPLKRQADDDYFWDMMYYSARVFTNAGDLRFTAVGPSYLQWLTLAQGLTGFALLGLILSHLISPGTGVIRSKSRDSAVKPGTDARTDNAGAIHQPHDAS